MSTCYKGCGLLAGAFLIVFTFVSFAAAKWITFGIGIAMVLHALAIKNCASDCFVAKHKTGEEIFLDKKKSKSDLPSKDEIKEILSKKKTAVKKTANKTVKKAKK